MKIQTEVIKIKKISFFKKILPKINDTNQRKKYINRKFYQNQSLRTAARISIWI